MQGHFTLTAHRNQSGATVQHTEKEKMKLALLVGGQELEDLFRFTAKVVVDEGDEQATYADAVQATKDALTGQVDEMALVYKMYTMKQGELMFSEYLTKVLKISQKINWDQMTCEKAAMCAMVINTSDEQFRQKALIEKMDYNVFRELGLSCEGPDVKASKLERTGNNKEETAVSDLDRLGDWELKDSRQLVENDIYSNNEFIIKMENDINDQQEDVSEEFIEAKMEAEGDSSTKIEIKETDPAIEDHLNRLMSRIKDTKEKEGVFWKCNACEYKGKSKTNMISHVEMNHGELKYKCKHCEYETKTSRALGRHMKNIMV